MKIVTNNQPRPLLDWWDLSEKEQAEFDWLETEEEQSSATFFRYKGQVYCLDEFTHTSTELFDDWDGLSSTSAFSAVLIKFVHGTDDEIVAGRCFC